MERKFTLHRIDVRQKDKAPADLNAPPRGAVRKEQKMDSPKDAGVARPKEIGGPTGPEPTRYGDWERNGICSDF